MEKKATKEFKSKMVREYSAVSTVDDLGMADNTMDLYVSEDGSRASIDWNIEYEDGEGDSIGIGLEIDEDDHKKITGYDGVFELNTYALEFLREQGYDVSEVE